MNNKKSIAGIAAVLIILTSAATYYSNNVIGIHHTHPNNTAQLSQNTQVDNITVLSLEGIIGKLPSISLEDLDTMTAGSCGIQVPYDLPDELS